MLNEQQGVRAVQRRRHEEQPRDPRPRSTRSAFPTCFASSGATQWGNHEVPVDDRVASSCRTRSRCKTFVDYLKKNKPNATIAVLKANDDFGQSYADTLTDLVKGTQLKVVQTQEYDNTGAQGEDPGERALRQRTPTPSCSRQPCSRARPRSTRRATRTGTRSRTCRARACRSCCSTRRARTPTGCSA